MLLQAAWRAHSSGNFVEAARNYGEILRRDPSQFDALYGFGVLQYQTGRFAEACELLARASTCNPSSPEPHFTRACALHRLQRGEEALTAFDRAIALRPIYAEALVNKGSVLMAMRRYEEALACFDAALAADSSFAQGWNNRGNALCELGRHAEAADCYARLLTLHPGTPEVLLNKGTALLSARRFDEAMASYAEALRIRPSFAQAQGGLGNALFSLKRYEEAVPAYEAALKGDPELAYGPGNLGFAKLHVCDWRGIDDIRTRIISGLAAEKSVVNPFQALALLDSERDHLRAASLWMKERFPVAAPAAPSPLPFRRERIRVVYLSTDFSEHAVATLAAGVFEHHDSSRFETFAISLANAPDSPMRTRLKRAFHHFIDAEDRTDTHIAAFLRENEIAIAVDLMGFTGEYRAGILMGRPAPVQVNYLGFPGTLASRHIDYIIADRTVLPEVAQGFYAEAPAYLPDCFIPNDNTRAIAAAGLTRAEAGLPENGFVFASFNASYKFTPAIFAIWMRLLSRIPGSVLWLAETNAAAKRNLASQARASGIAAERILFAPFAARPEDHLARLSLADLFLDTRPYNAHSTACDALWAGLPVLTCPGPSFAGRVGASLLSAVGLPELIARDAAEYERMALMLARDPEALGSIKAKLARNRKAAPLFDTKGYTRALENLYARMWSRHVEGLAPGAIG